MSDIEKLEYDAYLTLLYQCFYYFNQDDADLHESALAGTRQFIADQKLAYAAREVLSDAALSAGLSIVRKVAYGMASSAAAAGGAAATAGALPVLSTFGVQLTTGWILARFAEDTQKTLAEILFGTESIHNANLYLTALWSDPVFETTGTVPDSSGQPVEGVIVEVFGSDGSAEGAALTDSAGIYRFAVNRTDEYTLKFTKTGFSILTTDPVTIGEAAVTLAPVTLTAGESLNITACGLCGDKAVWLVYEIRKPIAGAGYTYHVQGTALSIVGAGAIDDYPYRGGPWNACDGFLSIIVGEGITSIGDGAFYHTEMSYSYTDVSLPGTLRSIGDDAFSALAFRNAMTLPEGLVSLGNNAFSNSTITALRLPASLREI